MCGIVGFVSKKYDLEDLKNMTNSLSHRGPNYGDSYFDRERGVGLGHRRLSILDLSDSANQPFHSETEQYVMVFNGEIYNFQSIAKSLKRTFKTTSDTEVILAAFEKWGVEFTHRLNGMFSIVLYDKNEQTLFLFRDRIGIKPLFYYRDDETFAFASELKALKRLRLNLRINQEAISWFLHLGYIPQPKTIFQNIFKFPEGHYGIFKNEGFEIRPYWKAEENVKTDKLTSYTDAKSQLKTLVSDAVKLRMISDVPLGTFLSGGIDSSTITALAQTHSSKPIKTFSIGFKESKFNESEYAKAVAQYLQTEHYEFILSEKDALDQFDRLLNIYDEPFADASAIPTLLVSEMARKHVTVALSGDGGDELFMGYGMYRWAERLSNPLIQPFRHSIARLLSLAPQNRLKRAATVFQFPNHQKLKTHLFSQEQYLFSEKEINQLLNSHSSKPQLMIENGVEFKRRLSPTEEQSFFDLTHYLKDDLLVKVDRASMFHALEVRVPLLDHRIVEFALNLDPKLKMKGNIMKFLLKEVLYDYVPSHLFDRPKWGFSIPLSKWLKSDLKYLIDRYLDEKVVEKYNLNPLFTKNLKQRFFNGQDYLYNRLWNLIILIKFLEETNTN